MDTSGTVNDQITDSVSQMNTLLIGSSAPQSLGIVDVAGAEALSMFMFNAVSAQQNSQISSSAAITSVCAKILQAQLPVPPPAPKVAAPEPHVPPPFMPLSPTISTNDLLAQANTLASAAMQNMKATQASAATNAELNQLLETLKTMQAANTPPAPAPAPVAPVAPSNTSAASAPVTAPVTPAPPAADVSSQPAPAAPASGGEADPEKKP